MEAQIQLTQVQTQIVEAEKNRKKMQREFEATAEQLRSLQEKYEALKQQYEKTLKETEISTKKLKETEEHYTKLQEQQKEWEEKVIETKNELNSLLDEKEKTEKLLNDLKEKLKVAENRAIRAQKSAEEIERKAKEFEETIKEAESHIERLTTIQFIQDKLAVSAGGAILFFGLIIFVFGVITILAGSNLFLQPLWQLILDVMSSSPDNVSKVMFFLLTVVGATLSISGFLLLGKRPQVKIKEKKTEVSI